MQENNSIKESVYLKKTGEWAEIVFNLPDKKVNVLFTTVMKMLSVLLGGVGKDKEIKGIFIAGGDGTCACVQIPHSGTGSRVIMGLPEVRLGFIPWFGGTWRLPRIVGVFVP